VPKQCKDCARWQRVENEQGDCVKEKVDIKGARFWAAKPARADNPACPDFVARDRV